MKTAAYCENCLLYYAAVAETQVAVFWTKATVDVYSDCLRLCLNWAYHCHHWVHCGDVDDHDVFSYVAPNSA